MDLSNHYQIDTLFSQLGLDSDKQSIEEFIANHHLSGNIRLDEAPFWSPSQSAFLREAINEDSDWAEIVDHLDTELRH
ncbi:DUF2789 domain-containing protein [Litoribacillus peritrichatus]|uniref:DUF2789 domain-containing protein n=1 Tax=Litoribacillus peritrichatus TaxID=718191 RepID=A0ABP7M6S1_9GAMM